MSTATITSKGQTTIPKDIRDALDLQPKDKIQFTLLSDGTVILRAKRRSILELHGMLHQPGSKPIPLDDMNPWK
ncbi:type II toxin-antitoxin system PrlF family antitoxin [Candidatus Thiothrix sp. Deng01]|uniref:Type II toxin-antitoxin system PrlF family antitoxin n=1 Tax=Candidatus Thiothrix phosphatis TaxID=3112415 RepID=A0ABU6CS53_9GAMM|nr:type II toxin-antitoxin system PrlF family antitoxin [Candidatus Thiothrix sp. Deng01]MEB4589663.1 type II toxin-antitoxin system PrlF family antitoxin [Candidatus Thiothrix sp. Deng01]